jgi:hypothetical protein
MPIPVLAYASAVVDNKIYVMGGIPVNGQWMAINATQIYDPATDKWTMGAPLPTPVSYAAAGATTGVMAPKRIYLMGGCINSGSGYGTDINQVYDPETDSWTAGLRTSLWKGYFDVEVYEPETGWIAGAPIPYRRFSFAVAVVNDSLYAMGGKSGPSLVDGEFVQPFLAYNEQYTPIGYGTPDRTAPEIAVLSPENKTYASGNVSLIFTVNKPVVWMGYRLDGQETVTISGNTTLAELTSGLHNVTVYAKDAFENSGASETITFTITKPEPSITKPEPFPTTWLAATIVSVAVVSVGILVYFRKRRR